MFDKVLIEVRGERGGERAGGSGCRGRRRSGGRAGGVAAAAAGGDMVGTRGGTPLAAEFKKGQGDLSNMPLLGSTALSYRQP